MPLYTEKTALGDISISERNGRINGLYFQGQELPKNAMIAKTMTLEKAFRQLGEYLEGRRKKFYLELAPVGTEFMHLVWQQVMAIPYGETRSYSEIAKAAGKPTATRAVGQANNRNPIPIFIPCHRVLGANGDLVGYAGGLDIKNQLLELEKKKIAASMLV